MMLLQYSIQINILMYFKMNNKRQIHLSFLEILIMGLLNFNQESNSGPRPSFVCNGKLFFKTFFFFAISIQDLLVFWMGHYLQKDKDCVGLEQNSRIEFAYWRHTVDLLLDTTDPKNKCSLNYYMNKESNIFANKPNRIDEYRCD